MNNSAQKIYPGLIGDSIEFFMDGKQLRYISGGKLKHFYEIPFMVARLLLEKINADVDLSHELMRMHPDSEIKRLEQYVICNFSGLDFKADIHNGVLQEGEYWPCPLRGICPGEGKICKSLKYNDQEISAVEISMIKLLLTDITNEALAEELCLPMGTFHKIKRLLYEKLGVTTKQEVAVIALALNLI